MLRRLPFLLPIAIFVAAAGGAAARSSQSGKVPARDRFSGRIRSGAGRYAGDHGGMSIDLHPGAATGHSRKLTVTIISRRCKQASGCLRLDGTLTGTITAMPEGPPDVGRSFAVKLNGKVGPLGHVTATGVATGTGYIYRGRESLTLTLRGTHGSVKLTARSAVVRGFTSP